MKLILHSLLFVIFISSYENLVAGELLSERTYRKLADVQKLIDKGSFDKALKKLNRVAKSVAGKNYENAVVQQTYGYLYTETDKMDLALEAYENSIKHDVLPVAVQQSVRLTLVSLYIQEEQWVSARGHMEKWLSVEKSPNPKILVLAAYIYLSENNHTQAIKLLNRAINSSAEAEESWFQLLVGELLTIEDYVQAAKVLGKVVERYPENKQYWQQLANTYYLLDKADQALAVMMVSYQKGFINSETELVKLAQMYLYQELPFQAASLLDVEITKGKLAENAANLTLLYQAYLAAREYTLADKVMGRLLPVSEDIDLVYEAALIKLELENWSQVIGLLKDLKLDGFPKKGEVLLLLGIAYYESGDYENARFQFDQARQLESSRKRAGQWLRHLQDRSAVSG